MRRETVAGIDANNRVFEFGTRHRANAVYDILHREHDVYPLFCMDVRNGDGFNFRYEKFDESLTPEQCAREILRAVCGRSDLREN
jgi:hypothetical protein